MLKAMALLFGSAVIMGVGIRIGSDAYGFVKRKIIFHKAEKLLKREGLEKLRESDPISKGKGLRLADRKEAVA